MKKIVPLVLTIMVTALFIAQAQQQSYSAQVSEARLLGKTKPLRDLNPVITPASYNVKTKARKYRPKQMPDLKGNNSAGQHYSGKTLPQGEDPLRQIDHAKDNTEILPILQFDGMDDVDANFIAPPDPVGAVGRDYYIQMINATGGALFQIWDKLGNEVYGPATANTFWEEFNVTGLGDPIVLYDESAGRWILSELGTFGTNVMLVAISVTGDPLGEWYAYELQAPDLPDYPKYGIWPDAYYITTNEPFDNVMPVYVVDRNAMLNGDSNVGLHRLTMPKFKPNAYETTSPVVWNGDTPPPDGSPMFIVRMYDDAWNGGSDKLEIWEINVDFDNPDNSIISGPLDIPVAPFDSQLCDNDQIFQCVEQPNGALISTLQHVVMFSTPYRNFGSYESIVLNFSVDVSGNNQGGIRWAELRKSGDEGWSLYQEGTYAPDENSRFMGSISMDAQGNILMGYTVVGPNQALTLRYTGRMADDPLGEMTFEEYDFANGSGIQPGIRWGDYSAMILDPFDERTFWFTGEYERGDNWRTRIVKTQLFRDSIDIWARAFVTPQNSGYLTDTEVVQVEIQNFGRNPIYDVDIHYQFNEGSIISEVITDTIAPDSTYIHSFAITVDMSMIGDYDFLAYTTLAADTFPQNDTIRTIISQLTRNDIAVTNVNTASGFICGLPATVEATVLNAGVDTLQSAELFYQVNAETPVAINWMGPLVPGGTDILSIELTNLDDGPNDITFFWPAP